MSNYRKHFTVKKSKHTVKIDGTELEPKQITMLGGSFEKKYQEQLESLIYNDNETIEFPKIITLILITEYLKDGIKPISILTNHTSFYKKKIIYVLGNFFDENYDVLEKMYDMYVGQNK